MLLYQIELSPKADKEFTDAVEYYETKQIGLGDQFLLLIIKKLDLISKYPNRYRKIKGKFRQVSIAKFPYCIVYYIKPEESIVRITSIFHHSRNPNRKFRS